MKNVILGKIILPMLFAPLVISCSNDSNEPQSFPQEPTPLLITASQNSEVISRVGFGNDGAVVNWILGDKFTVFGASDKQSFSLVSGEDTPQGVFEGNSPTGDGPYKALYPDAKGEWNVYADCMLDATGQKQAVNGDMNHLANYTYMTGDVVVDDEGKANVSFSHQMVMMKFVLTLPENVKAEEILQTFLLRTDQPDAFILKKGASDDTVIESETGTEISMDISGMEIGDDNTVTLYMMMVPFSLNADSKLKITIETQVKEQDPRGEDEAYQQRFYEKILTLGSDKEYEKGMRYTATETMEPIRYPIETGVYSYPVKITNTQTKKSYYVVQACTWDKGIFHDAYMSLNLYDKWLRLYTKNGIEEDGISIEKIFGLDENIPDYPNTISLDYIENITKIFRYYNYAVAWLINDYAVREDVQTVYVMFLDSNQATSYGVMESIKEFYVIPLLIYPI